MESSSKMVITPGTTSFFEGTMTPIHHGGYVSHTSSPFPPCSQRWSHRCTLVLRWTDNRGILPFIQDDGLQHATGAVAYASFHRNVGRDVTGPSDIDTGYTVERGRADVHRPRFRGSVCTRCLASMSYNYLRCKGCTTHERRRQTRNDGIQLLAQRIESGVCAGTGALV